MQKPVLIFEALQPAPRVLQMNRTAYPHVNHLLDDMLADITSVLGAKLVGLYLYGSLVVGDFDESVSDIDMLAATAGDIEEDEMGRLAAMHRQFADRYKEWEDRIEVQYIATAGQRSFKSTPRRMVVISPSEPLHFVDGGIDWLVNWYFARESGIALFGPRPQFAAKISDKFCWEGGAATEHQLSVCTAIYLGCPREHF